MMRSIAGLTIVMMGALTSAAAQPTAGRTNLPLAIIMVDELPFAPAKAVVIRRKDMKPQNIVLVTNQTSPTDLTRAMAALFKSRLNKGDVVTADMVAPIAASQVGARSKDYPQAAKDLAALRTARPRFIEGVGSRPVVFSHIRPAPSRGSQGSR